MTHVSYRKSPVHALQTAIDDAPFNQVSGKYDTLNNFTWRTCLKWDRKYDYIMSATEDWNLILPHLTPLVIVFRNSQAIHITI